MDFKERFKHPKRRRQLIQRWAIIAAITLSLVGLGIWQYWSYLNNKSEPISLPQLVSAVQAGEIETITVRGDILIAEKSDGTRLKARKESSISAVESLQFFGLPENTVAELPIVIEERSAPRNPFTTWISIVLLATVGFVIYRYSQEGGGGLTGLFNGMSRSNARLLSGDTDKDAKQGYALVTFRDVAGVDQAKHELQEIVEFLKEPAKFARLGARTPKGVLMIGPPGTGKTLLAKAVAGEAGVPFFTISASEFVEMFVGVGAARVRNLFKRAKSQSPAVIFVDEIDAVGRQRGAGHNGSNDEREQTLNQILVEMDGFGTDTNIIIVAATNRPDVLDPALLRPGRFDRKVTLDRPDIQGREEILAVHTKDKPFAPDVSISDLARLTPGFVGADLENLVNEAAILAARRNLKLISWAECQDAIERIIAGPERRGKLLNKLEREVVAYHEAGHALVMYNLENSDPVHKVSIISRGMALGYTMPLPETDKYLRTREAFEDEIVGLFGGRAAEDLIFGQITTGAANDLERATQLARAMVTRYAFSRNLSQRTFGEEQGNQYLGALGEVRNYSEEMAQTIDREIDQILDAAYRRARNICTEQQSHLEAVAKALLVHETIDRAQFEELMVS